MPRFSQWEQPSQAEEPKRQRLYGSTPLDEYDDGFGGLGLDLAHPHDSPELAVALPVDIAHELSQRVELDAGGGLLSPYDEIHGRLARLDRLDEASVGKLLSKGELICMLTENGITGCRDGAASSASLHGKRKSALVVELLLAIKERRIAATLEDAKRQRLRAPREDDEATLPPDELQQLDGGGCCTQRPCDPEGITQMPNGLIASQGQTPLQPAPLDHLAAPALGEVAPPPTEPAIPPAPRVRAVRLEPLPPASLDAAEESFVWKLLTGALEPIDKKSPAKPSRSVHTQTEPAPTSSSVEQPQPLSQLQQSQACVQSSQPAYCSNSRDVDDLVQKVRKLLKASPMQTSDSDIRDALDACGFHVMQTVEALRARPSPPARRAIPALATSADNMARTWEERLARGSLF
jgi:hypothetical protein